MPKGTGNLFSKLYLVKDCGAREGTISSPEQLRAVSSLARAVVHENPGRDLHIFAASNNGMLADCLAAAVPAVSVVHQMNALQMLDIGDRQGDNVIRETIKGMVKARPGEVLLTINGSPSLIIEIFKQRIIHPWNFAMLDVATLTISGHGQIVSTPEFMGTKLQEEQADIQYRNSRQQRRSAG